MRGRTQSKVLSAVLNLRRYSGHLLDCVGGDVVAAALRDVLHGNGGHAGEAVAQCAAAAGVGPVRALCDRHYGGSDARDNVRRDCRGGGPNAEWRRLREQSNGASQDGAAERGLWSGLALVVAVAVHHR